MHLRVPFITGLLFCSLVGAHAQTFKSKSTSKLGGIQLEQGQQANEKRVGKWNFYNRAGELELTFDYDSSRISFLKPDTARYLVRVGEEWQPKRLNRAPHLLGSPEQRLTDLARNVRYPISALQAGTQGTVLLSYTVAPDGHTTDYSIESGLSKDCDQEVWRVLQLLPDAWIPAVYQGRPTATRHFLKVNFQMMSEAEYRKLQQQTPAPAAPRPAYLQEVEVTAIGVQRSGPLVPAGSTRRRPIGR